MGLEKLKDAYNPLAIKEYEKPQLASWQDSGSVSRLSWYLKEHPSGISLIICKGSPALCFNPGLKKQDGEARWTIARNAAQLLIDALPDLDDLLSSGKMQLPEVSI